MLRHQTITSTAKRYARKSLEEHGWYVRKTMGLSSGVDCFLEIRDRLGIKLDIVFDIGAHRGETVADILDQFPNAQIFAFEPVPSNFQALQINCSKLPNVTCYCLALADREGAEDIFIQDDTQTHTLKRPLRGGSAPALTASIEIATLDGFLQNRNVAQIDLLKIDVEGCELRVLAGAAETLNQNPPRLILAEATLDPSDQVHTSLWDTITCLSRYGYRILSIYDQAVWRKPMHLAYFNALFVRE
jgi:FkbM family methyltransferase